MRARGREACDFRRGGVIELLLSFTGHKTLEELGVFFLAFLVCNTICAYVFTLVSSVNSVGGFPRAKNIRSTKGGISSGISHEFQLLVCPRRAIFELLCLAVFPAFQPISEQRNGVMGGAGGT